MGPPSVWVRPGPFTSSIQLKAAVNSCLAASPSGACNCDSAAVDCGPAVYDGITQWNTALVTDMSELFKSAQSFNADISAWNTTAVTNMQFMFQAAARVQSGHFFLEHEQRAVHGLRVPSSECV